MDQQKIGLFLKTLRKQQELTQEQFAEIMNVSNRTVSRWENGNNLPDIDILIQIADYYKLDLRELLDGERKSEKMNKATEETVLKAVDYTNIKAEKYVKRIHGILIAGVILWFISQIVSHTGLIEIKAIHAFTEFMAGTSCGLILWGIFITSRFGEGVRAFKKRILKL